MSNKKKPVKSPRREPNRTTTEAVLVRMTTAERGRMEAAITKLIAGRPLRGTVARFMLDAGLAEATRVLTVKAVS